MKLLLLTATPMFNEATEIVWLINLMNLMTIDFQLKLVMFLQKIILL